MGSTDRGRSNSQPTARPAALDRATFTYLPLVHPTPEQVAELRDQYNLPAPLVEHLQDQGVAPGLLRNEGYVYARLNVPARLVEDHFDWDRVDLILGQGLLILIQPRELTVVRRALARFQRRQQQGPSDLFALVIAQVVEGFHLLYWSIERELSTLEADDPATPISPAALRAQVTQLDHADDALRALIDALVADPGDLLSEAALNELHTALDRLATIEADADRIELQIQTLGDNTPTETIEAREEKVLGAETPEIIEAATRVGERRLERLNLAHAMTAFVGGLAVSFGAVAMAMVGGPWLESLGQERAQVLGAVVFPIGFVILLIGKGELFTENFFVPVTGVIRGNGRVRDLLSLWAYVLFFNIVGALLFAFLLSRADVLDSAPRQFLINLAVAKVHYSFELALLRGIFAGWLMTIMTWLILAADGLGARLVIIWMIGFLIVAGHFNHVVISVPEVFTAIWLGAPITIGDWFTGNFVPALIGNLIGGVVFVTLLGYAQARTLEISADRLKAEE